MKRVFLWLCMAACLQAKAQEGLVKTGNSPYAKLSGVGLMDVQWTSGFWADRFNNCRNAMIPALWRIYTSKDSCFSFENFRIAAGLDTGSFRGPSFHDGDFYKTLEGVAAMYAQTRDPKLDVMMDSAIAVIALAQRTDGYIYTKSIIEQRKSGREKMFDDRLSFEAYNFGHLMTAACVHFRATGKRSLLNIAARAADFLISFYAKATPEQARNAICPSHYMGITELYRTTGEPRYLELVKKLVDIRGTVEGTDDNSDRQPFRKMTRVAGHAVRANYLFAGVADLYAETGDASLLQPLDTLWEDVVHRKMYVTGGCGALYDGVSVDGTSYQPDTVQKIHQAYGRDYQLPNLSAHNETCANIGNLLWNWRMLQLTGESKYADVMELALYNSILSGVDLHGTKFFYTNPLASVKDYPYHLRWEGGRQPYIALSNCCPPNLMRTIAEVNNYVYSIAEDGLYIHLYGGNHMLSKLKDGSEIELEQQTDYPWTGNVRIQLQQAPAAATSLYLRIPGWCSKYNLSVNGAALKMHAGSNGYIRINRRWKKGDHIELQLDMPVTLIEANPLVEEIRGQTAVKRGPVVYCLESTDLSGDNLFNVELPANINLRAVPFSIAGSRMMALTGRAELLQPGSWQHRLYRPVKVATQPINIRMIPYYAWANRGQTDMAVWMPLKR